MAACSCCVFCVVFRVCLAFFCLPFLLNLCVCFLAQFVYSRVRSRGWFRGCFFGRLYVGGLLVVTAYSCCICCVFCAPILRFSTCLFCLICMCVFCAVCFHLCVSLRCVGLALIFLGMVWVNGCNVLVLDT